MVRTGVLESDENLGVLSMLVMAGDSAEVSILMFAGHELVVPVHFRTSGLGDGYIRGHRCCSYCRFSLSCTARGLYLELLPMPPLGACSRFHCAVPFCCALRYFP